MPDIFDIRAFVQCDYCGKVYRNEDGTILDATPGGLLFGSNAACPACAPRIEEGAQRHGETEHISLRCPPDKPFAVWVVEDIRAGDNTIRVYIGEEVFDAPPRQWPPEGSAD